MEESASPHNLQPRTFRRHLSPTALPQELQGYFNLKKAPPPWTLQGPCLGPYGGSRVGGMRFEWVKYPCTTSLPQHTRS